MDVPTLLLACVAAVAVAIVVIAAPGVIRARRLDIAMEG